MLLSIAQSHAVARAGRKKAAKCHLLKERRKGDAKSEHEPRCARGTKDVFDRCVFWSGQKGLIERGESKAAKRHDRQPPAKMQRRCAAPLNPGKEALVPKQRKNHKAQGKCNEIEYCLKAQDVMNIGADVCEVFSAKEMEVQCRHHEHCRADEPDAGERCQQAEMAEMRNSFGRSDFSL